MRGDACVVSGNVCLLHAITYLHFTHKPDTYQSTVNKLNALICFYFQVQNIEKAGILNKTKVSENGKKVR